MIRISLLALYFSAAKAQYFGYGPFGLGGELGGSQVYPVGPVAMNPFGVPSPYGMSPMYDAMMAYPDCIGLHACGIPYGGYGMYGNMNGMGNMNAMGNMNGMASMNGMNGMVNGLNGVNAMNGYSGVNGMSSMQNAGTVNNGNTMRSSMNRISGSRTRYGAVGCNGGCNNGGWMDATKVKKA